LFYLVCKGNRDLIPGRIPDLAQDEPFLLVRDPARLLGIIRLCLEQKKNIHLVPSVPEIVTKLSLQYLVVFGLKNFLLIIELPKNIQFVPSKGSEGPNACYFV